MKYTVAMWQRYNTMDWGIMFAVVLYAFLGALSLAGLIGTFYYFKKSNYWPMVVSIGVLFAFAGLWIYEWMERHLAPEGVNYSEFHVPDAVYVTMFIVGVVVIAIGAGGRFLFGGVQWLKNKRLHGSKRAGHQSAATS